MKAESGRLVKTPKGTAIAEKTTRYREHQVNVFGIIGARTNNPRSEMNNRIAVKGTNLIFCLILT
jgi:hypothetical protein